MARSAQDPWSNGQPLHLPWRTDLTAPSVFLLPGDPARVDLAKNVFDEYEMIGQNREFRIAIGTRSGVRIGVCSTGIGGPSTEIAIVELSRLGVHTMIRVGGMGSLREDIPAGTVTVVATALRDGGTARFYAANNHPVPSHPEVLTALQNASIRLGMDAPQIQILSADSYYLGEGRPLPGLEARARNRFAEVNSRGADGMDMECETVLAVAGALGCHAGAVIIAHANRVSDEWFEDYAPAQEAALTIAVEAAVSLS